MESARPASPDELPRCVELLTAAREEVARQRGGLRLLGGRPDGRSDGGGADEADALASWAEQPGHVLLAGLFDGAVVGIGAATAGERSEGVGRIEACFVEPGARRVGVGAALLGALLDWLAGRGCVDVDAVALPGDRSTKQLLESAGFKARLLVLHRPGGPAQPR